MKFTRKIAFILALLMLGGNFAACASDEAAESTGDTAASTGDSTAEVAEEVVEEKLEWYERTDLEDTDWEGKDFHVLGQSGFFGNIEIYTEAINGDIVNDAIYERNLEVSEKYNVKISEQLEEYPIYTLQESVWAGDHMFDLSFLTLETIATAAVNGYYYDLNEVPNINLEKDYWNPTVNEQLKIKDKLVIASSDFSLSDKYRVYCMIYNPSLGNQYGIDYIVDTVREGKWTADLMKTYMKSIPQDVDGDGEMTENDQYALTMDSYNAFAAFYYGFDNRAVTRDSSTKEFTLTMNTLHSVDSIDKVVNLICDRNEAFFCEDFSNSSVSNIWATSCDTFYAGRALFTTMFPQTLSELSEKADFDYTVIPFPKFDESQESYTTLADIYSMLFGVPNTNADPTFAGFMLEALSAAATDTTLSAYYDIACKTKYSYNEDNGEMLDLIFNGIIYEPAMLYSIGDLFTIVNNIIPSNRENNFSSTYASMEASAQLGLESLLKDFEDTYGE